MQIEILQYKPHVEQARERRRQRGGERGKKGERKLMEFHSQRAVILIEIMCFRSGSCLTF